MTNKKIAEPEVILVQMISFLEKETTTIRERTNIGTSNEHAKYGIHNSPSSSRSEPQPITDQQPDTETTTTTPPPAIRAIPNAPDLNTNGTSMDDEPGLQSARRICYWTRGQKHRSSKYDPRHGCHAGQWKYANVEDLG